jgi:hypothetical protein
MTHANTLIASAAVIALTLGITSRADTPTETETPLPLGSMIIAAGDDAATAGQSEDTGQSEDNAEDSAKMGEEEGTHEGANLGATPENDTDKIDQPARRNPTTGASAADQTGAH